MKIDISERLSKGCIADIREAIKLAGRATVQPRLVRVPVDDFVRATNAAMQAVMMPFQPMVCGLPCEPYARERPALVCVGDDDTNLEQESIRTIEFHPGVEHGNVH